MAERGESQTDMVLVMGVTGAGKSYLVNKLKEGAVVEGDGLESSMGAYSIFAMFRAKSISSYLDLQGRHSPPWRYQSCCC